MSDPQDPTHTYPTEAANDLIAEYAGTVRRDGYQNDNAKREAAAHRLLDQLLGLFAANGFGVNRGQEKHGAGRFTDFWVFQDPKTEVRVVLGATSKGRITQDSKSGWFEIPLHFVWNEADGTWLGERLRTTEGPPLRDTTKPGAPYVRKSPVEQLTEYVLNILRG